MHLSRAISSLRGSFFINPLELVHLFTYSMKAASSKPWNMSRLLMRGVERLCVCVVVHAAVVFVVAMGVVKVAGSGSILLPSLTSSSILFLFSPLLNIPAVVSIDDSAVSFDSSVRLQSSGTALCSSSATI